MFKVGDKVRVKAFDGYDGGLVFAGYAPGDEVEVLGVDGIEQMVTIYSKGYDCPRKFFARRFEPIPEELEPKTIYRVVGTDDFCDDINDLDDGEEVEVYQLARTAKVSVTPAVVTLS